MEVGFAIPRAGPLTQISLQLIRLETAVYLATGAYGWWKARERSQSLLEVLEAGGVHLSSTSSFNWNTYQAIRELGQLRGVVVQTGQLQYATLPKASTALPNNAAEACLRASVTGLLCFYDVDASTALLVEIIPDSLLQYEQEGTEFNIEGPKLTSLKNFISAVAAEEDNNTFREMLLEKVDKARSALTGAPLTDIVGCESANQCEFPLIIGMIQWALTPIYRRHFATYPTRSLLVWLIATALSKLGFEIRPSKTVITTADDFTRLTSVSKSTNDQADIFLCTAAHGVTDPLMLNRVINPEADRLRPRLGQIRAVPWVLFRRESGTPRKINPQYLADVWMFSFSNSYEKTAGIYFDHGSPPSSNGDQKVKDNCKVMIAIVLGTIFGIISRCLYDEGQPCSLDTEIAIHPDMIYNYQMIFTACNTIGHGIDGTMSPLMWIDCILMLCLGRSKDDSWNTSILKRLILGGSLNGITVVSDIVIRPSTDPNSLMRMHIQKGRILNLPVMANGLILASDREQARLDLILNPDLEVDVLKRNPSIPCPTQLRIDAEPCWEANPDQATFRVRDEGRIVGSIDINYVFHRLAEDAVFCTCKKNVKEVSVARSHRWQHVGLHQIMKQLPGQALVEEGDKILVDTSSSESATLVAIGAIRARKTKISMGCLQCTYDALRNVSNQDSVAIIVAK